MYFVVEEEIGVLGRGAFGDAVLCRYRQKEMECVVKRIPKLIEDERGEETHLTQLWRAEVIAMAAVSSKYIVDIFDAFEDKKYMYITMEYCAKGNLRGLLMSLEMEGKAMREEV
jgi:serine/threonine protein kinase